MDIKNNKTLKRKSSYIPSVFRDDKKEDHIDYIIKNINLQNYQKTVSNNLGIYIRPIEFDIYIDNNASINRTIQINSSNRNITFFQSPFNFTTYIGNNNFFNDGKKDIYITPRIQNIIPNITAINLKKIIIPNNFTIIETNISNNIKYIIIKNLTDDVNKLISNQIEINKSYLINSTIITIVNFVNNKKLNFIVNYDPKNVFSFLLNNNNEIDINNILLYYVDYSNPSKQQRIFNLVIKELDDHFNYDTNNSNDIATFKLYPSSIKNKFLYADNKDITKIYDINNPIKLNKLSIILLDNNFKILKINFLDNELSTTILNNKCNCNQDSKEYSCSCNYILHPFNPNYQLYLFFDFKYKQMTPYNSHI